MSIVIHPCRMCPIRERCDLRANLRKRATATGARSVTYDCPRLSAELRPGRRIEISTPYLDRYDPDDGSPIIRRRVAPATVTSIDRSYRFTCVVDPSPEFGDKEMEFEEVRDRNLVRFRRRRRHSTILRLLDEPDMPLCEYGRVQRDGVCDVPGTCECEESKALAAKDWG